MLRLAKMELCGFKSFSDRTEIRFQDGITAIVGPNGCGKSNIGDAINWVLGEQSAKMLRGRQMADVIFAGSAGRKPVGMAEVTLTFEGGDALPHNDQGRIAVTRRLFRSGESEYRLNGARARLMDIQDLLRQGKVGARTYATIEQGKIDQVLNAKPKERRALIEDAAGISGYKHKRRLAELKLEATHANLLRVNDIVTEVQRQINSLKRQAAKARRYRRLRDELREKELVCFAGQALALDSALAEMCQAERSARDAESEAMARLATLEARLTEQRRILDEAGGAFRESSERLHRQELEIDREETQIRSCRERGDEALETARQKSEEAEALQGRRAETRERDRGQQARIEQAGAEFEQLARELEGRETELTDAEAELRGLRDEVAALRRRQFEALSHAAELRNRRQSTEETLRRTDAQRARLDREHRGATDEYDGARELSAAATSAAESHRGDVEQRREAQTAREERLAEMRRRQTTEQEALSGAREAEKSTLARLATLEDIETRFTGVSDGVKTLLASGAAHGIRTHGVVADYVEASREIEAAAECYLGALLPTVILEDDADVRRAAEVLRSAGAGRTSLICRTQPAGELAVGAPGNGHSNVPIEILDDRRVLGRLRDRLTLKASANGAVADRIGDAILVDSLASALDLHRRFPEVDYLTEDGDVVFASGVIEAGGRSNGGAGLLVHRRRLQELQAEAARAQQESRRLNLTVQSSSAETEQLEDAVREGRETLEQFERRAVELDLQAQRAVDEAAVIGRRASVLADELASLAAEIDPLRQMLREATVEASAAEESQRAIERSLEELAARAEKHECTIKICVEQVAQCRAERATRDQRREALLQEGRLIGEQIAEFDARIESLRADAAEADERSRSSAELLARTEVCLIEHLEQRRALQTGLGEMERDIADRQQKLSTEETELRAMRADAEGLREQTREAEVARTRAEATREHLDDLCRQELGVPATAAVEQAGDTVRDLDPDALLGLVAEIKEKLERIGPVNMTAIEEFSELEERDAFLTAQRSDLEKSMESLRETMRRINRQSRERFAEAFEAIRQSYQEVYKLLFSGGRADLRLEEGEDVLECGIEILAQPPGKRLTGVHLLSGGEKALSAIALLFAIFRYQPSPFCMLDEVDAALDDANVGRFARMVREYAKHTQFVLVTHNKLSMEAANLLYGVTMEEPGVSKIVSLQLQPSPAETAVPAAVSGTVST